jgi:FkbM family methyltransferase
MMKCFIICFNNGWLVKQAIQALQKFSQLQLEVVDNASDGTHTLTILDELKSSGVVVHSMPKNYGHTVVTTVINPQDEQYFITDPDLEFEYLPDDTIQQLLDIHKQTKAKKVGLALKIDAQDFLEGIYFQNKSIAVHESQFWLRRVNNLISDVEAYYAEIDTTFALYSKGSVDNLHIRLAGSYCVRHLPWHKSWVDSTSAKDLKEYLRAVSKNSISTTSKLIQDYINNLKNNSVLVHKNKIQFNVTLTENRSFWINHYPSWEPETFEIFDRFADPNKLLVDIGTWIGPTLLYGSQRFHHVFGVEADQQSFKEVNRNVMINNIENVTLYPYAIYNQLTTVHFGKNKFRSDALANDSTSQIQEQGSLTYEVTTITLDKLLVNVKPETIGLIKVDIEGGEESILEELLQFHLIHKVPIYVSFHYSWWNNKNKLNTLTALFDQTNVANIVQTVRNSPFCSILLC